MFSLRDPAPGRIAPQGGGAPQLPQRATTVAPPTLAAGRAVVAQADRSDAPSGKGWRGERRAAESTVANAILRGRGAAALEGAADADSMRMGPGVSGSLTAVDAARIYFEHHARSANWRFLACALEIADVQATLMFVARGGQIQSDALRMPGCPSRPFLQQVLAEALMAAEAIGPRFGGVRIVDLAAAKTRLLGRRPVSWATGAQGRH